MGTINSAGDLKVKYIEFPVCEADKAQSSLYSYAEQFKALYQLCFSRLLNLDSEFYLSICTKHLKDRERWRGEHFICFDLFCFALITERSYLPNFVLFLDLEDWSA